jgi:hypothetical protein
MFQEELQQVDVDVDCAVCHRSTTSSHPLHFEELHAANAVNLTLKLRKFGDRTGMIEGLLVCVLCSIYVCPRTNAQRNTHKHVLSCYFIKLWLISPKPTPGLVLYICLDYCVEVLVFHMYVILGHRAHVHIQH